MFLSHKLDVFELKFTDRAQKVGYSDQNGQK